MKLIIDVNDELYKDLVEKELNELPREKIQELLIQSLASFLADKDNAKNVFLVKEDYYRATPQPSKLLISAVDKSVNMEDISKEISDVFIQYIKNNADTIMPGIIENVFVKGLVNNDEFKNSIKSAIMHEIPSIAEFVQNMIKRN